MSIINITEDNLLRWLDEWEAGRSKNDIERVELDDPRSHGKAITALWREHLGVETEGVHPLRLEVDRLRSKLRDHGIDPDA